MKYICETLFRLKEALELALKLNDVKLRYIISNLLSDMNKAVEIAGCIDNIDDVKGLEHIEKEGINYII